MSATYDPKQETDKDRVRFLIRDTKDARMVLDDDEILAVLAVEANLYLAAARCGDIILGNSKGLTSMSVDRVSVTRGQFSGEAYATHVRNLREKGCRLLLIASTGGGCAAFGVL